MTNDMRVIVEFAALSPSFSPSPSRRGCSVSESYFKTKGSDGIQIRPRVLLHLFFCFFFFPFGAWEMGVDGFVFRLCTFSL